MQYSFSNFFTETFNIGGTLRVFFSETFFWLVFEIIKIQNASPNQMATLRQVVMLSGAMPPTVRALAL